MIPSLPTDNLYKFMALSGLVIIAFSFTYALHLRQKIMVLYYESTVAADQNRLEVKRLLYSSEALSESLEVLREELSKVVISDEEVVHDISVIKENLKNEEYREHVKFMHEYGDDVIPYRSESIQLKRLAKEHADKLHQLESKEIYIAKLNEKMVHLFDRIKMMSRIMGVGVSFGLILASTGFILWYYRVQKVLDLKLKLEMHEALVELAKLEKK